MTFIKFLQRDSSCGAITSEVVVNIGQIVKIEPVWYEETADGRKARVTVDVSEMEDATLQGYQKGYTLYDSLGGVWSSFHAANEGGRDKIEQLWLDAV